MKIAVLMGGTSLERSASLQSGQAVCEALLHDGHRVCAVDTAVGLSGDVLTEGRIFTDFPPNLRMESAAPESVQERLASLPLRPRGAILAPGVMEACTGADVVFPVLFGRNEEDGHLQAVLEIMGRPYTGCSYLGAAIAFDKEVAKRLMRQAGIPTPDWTIASPEAADSSQSLFGLNGRLKVVKPVRGGSSIGVKVAKNNDELGRAVNQIVKSGEAAMIEDYVPGREFTIGILGDRALGAIEIDKDGEIFDYDAKYHLNEKSKEGREPDPLSSADTEQIKELAASVHKALKLGPWGYSRTDFIRTPEGSWMCLETNSPPGMTRRSGFPSSALAAGLPYEDLCERIVELGLCRDSGMEPATMSSHGHLRPPGRIGAGGVSIY